MRQYALLTLLIFVMACEHKQLLTPDNAVSIETLQDRFRIINSSNTAIYYIVIPNDILPLIDWIPCTDPDSCDGVPAKSSRELPYKNFYELQREELVSIFYWNLQADGTSGWRAASMKTQVVQLPANAAVR